MNKKLIYSFLFSISFISLTLTFPHKCYADIGWMPQPGGTIVAGDKIDDIEMTSENVLYDIQINEDGDYIAHATATFNMTNLSSTDINRDIMFPYHNPYDEIDEDRVGNISVKINNSTTDYSLSSFIYNNDNYSYWEGSGDVTHAISFNTTFKAKTITKIEISYDLHLEYYPRSGFLIIDYIMATGSNWEGFIGEGKVTIRFPVTKINKYAISYNDCFEIKNNELIWEFSNLEPTQDNDIHILFSPDQFEDFESRASYIKDIDIHGDLELIGESFPLCHYINNNNILKHSLQIMTEIGWFSCGIDISSMGMLNNETTEDCYIPKVLLMKVDKNNPNYITYQFDNTYKVYYLNLGLYNIFSLYANEEAHPSFTGLVQDLLSKPSTIKVTYSDNTSATFDIDSSEETLYLGGKETSLVKVEFLNMQTGLEKEGEEIFLVDYLEITTDADMPISSNPFQSEQACILEMYNNDAAENSLITDKPNFVDSVTTNTSTKDIINLKNNILLSSTIGTFPLMFNGLYQEIAEANLSGIYNYKYSYISTDIPSGWLFTYNENDFPYIQYTFKNDVQISNIRIYDKETYVNAYLDSSSGSMLGVGRLGNILANPTKYKITLSDGESEEFPADSGISTLIKINKKTNSLKIEVLGVEPSPYEDYKNLVFIDYIEIEEDNDNSDNNRENDTIDNIPSQGENTSKKITSLIHINSSWILVGVLIISLIIAIFIVVFLKAKKKDIKNLEILKSIKKIFKHDKEDKKED